MRQIAVLAVGIHISDYGITAHAGDKCPIVPLGNILPS